MYSGTEVAGGLWTGSLALLADAGHLLSDVGALLLSLFAIWIAARPASLKSTFGHARAEILAALANGLALIAIAVFVAFEAVGRWNGSESINGLGMVGFAAGALCVNVTGLVILSGGSKSNLNLRAAWLHVLSDALGSFGAIVAGTVIWAFGWIWADPIASLLIAALVLHASFRLVRAALSILMESAPEGIDVKEVLRVLRGLPSVAEVHDLHVWSVGSADVSLSTHVVMKSGVEVAPALERVRAELRQHFDIFHSTIQIEEPGRDGCTGACSVRVAC